MREILVFLNEINGLIAKQIPFIANRFPALVEVPRGADKAFMDDLARRTKLHTARLDSAIEEYFILEKLEEEFANYCRQQNLVLPLNVSEESKTQLKAHILARADAIIESSINSIKVLKKNMHLDAKNLLGYLNKNIDSIIDTLGKGQKITGTFEEFEARLKVMFELAKHRKDADKHVKLNSQFILSVAAKQSQQDLMEKVEILGRAKYFYENNIGVGFCEEHASIALMLFLQKCHTLPNKEVVIEKLSVEYEDGDGHTFIAVNRDPNSRLHDFASWGEKAILWDPWHGFACFATQYHNLEVQFSSYPASGKWSTLNYTGEDAGFLTNIDDYETYLTITGFIDPLKREQKIMEEFQLISLDGKELRETKDFLYKLVDECRPQNLTFNLKVYLTSSGNQLVSVIRAPKESIIAIHLSFLYTIIGGYSILDELIFALKFELLQMLKFGVGIQKSVSQAEKTKIDFEILRHTGLQLGHAAVEYLRKSVKFKKIHPGNVQLPALLGGSLFESDVDQNRIKSIMTFLGQTTALQRNIVEKKLLPPKLVSEVAKVRVTKMFVAEVSQYATPLQKIRYLITRLPDLHEELIPYEFAEKPSLRVRHFCDVLDEIRRESSDLSVDHAIDELVIEADNLCISAFKYIYQRLNGSRASGELIPLGNFKKLKVAIQQFIEAKDSQETQKCAVDILNIRQSLRRHFFIGYLRDFAVRNYAGLSKDAAKNVTRIDRFFGTNLGYDIDWLDFLPKEHSWEEHIKWAIEKQSAEIAKVLFLLGLYEEDRLLPCYSLELFEEIRNLTCHPIAFSPSGEAFEDCYEFEGKMLAQLSSTHILDATMLLHYKNFGDALKEFYKKNKVALMSHGYHIQDARINQNNETVHFLLQKFLEVIKSGSDVDRNAVKSFFIDGGTDFNLAKLLADGDLLEGTFQREDPFFKFLVEQEYEGEKFDFFTKKERYLLFTNGSADAGQLQWLHFVDMFDLPSSASTIANLKKVCHHIKVFENTPYRALFKNFIAQITNLQLFSPEGVEIIKLAHQCSPYTARDLIVDLLSDFTINDYAQNIDIADLVLIYKLLDSALIFPSLEIQQQFANLIILKLRELTDINKVILIAEILLSSSMMSYFISLTDLSFRNTLVSCWVQNVVQVFGKDDNTEEYFDKIRVVIKRIHERISARDSTLMLSQLAAAINSQKLVSFYIGTLVEPEKFSLKKTYSDKIAILGHVSSFTSLLNKNKNDQLQLLNFLSSPLTKQSLDSFEHYIVSIRKGYDVLSIVRKSIFNDDHKKINRSLNLALVYFYNSFWNCTLEERAVIIDYLFIPANCVVNEQQMINAYHSAFIYVTDKVFPDKTVKNSDGEFAYYFLWTYLALAGRNRGSLLLSGLLVASNQDVGNSGNSGQKLVKLFGHLGYSYTKLAQIIHSYRPEGLSEEILKSLGELKHNANPPDRWNLWRQICDTLPMTDRLSIRSVNQILGSASYNIAVAVELMDNSRAVLSLLRENARADSDSGFDLLKAAIQQCTHVRIQKIKDTAVAMLEEAQLKSHDEMSHQVCEKQYEAASEIYGQQIKTGSFTVNISPAKLIKCGPGYRFITFCPGVSFNRLSIHPDIRRQIALAIVLVEWGNLFGRSDTDRHGEQLGIEIDYERFVINIGCFDFGELNLIPPNQVEIQQFLAVIKECLSLDLQNFSIHSFDEMLSKHIDRIKIEKGDVHFLMRIRKSLLALQDFQRYLTVDDFILILKTIAKSNIFDDSIQQIIRQKFWLLNATDSVGKVTQWIKGVFQPTAAKEQLEIIADCRVAQVSPSKQTDLSKTALQ